MSSVRRDFVASPGRLSPDTWNAIANMICQDDSAAKAQFEEVKGIGACLLDDEAFAENPLVMKNRGPRLKIYCLYGADAISGENKNEEGLSWKPTAEKWAVFLPCLTENLEAMKKTLKGKSAHFELYDVAAGPPEPEERTSKASASDVDWEAFKKL